MEEEAVWISGTMQNLNSPQYDYTMIVFIGHGGAYSNNDIIQLSKGARIPVNCFFAPNGMDGVIKRSIIIDACRTIVGGSPNQIVIEQRLFCGQEQIMGNYCKHYYNNVINNCEPHIELIQSTQYGAIAHANTTGTAFSDAFFATLNTNVPQWNAWALQDRCGQLSVSTSSMMSQIQPRMESYRQVPQFSRIGVGRGDFPIYAVWRIVGRALQ